MRLLSVKEYVEFRCSGGECPITCCGGGWRIIIDKKTLKKYESVESELRERLCTDTEEKEEGICFKMDEEGKCTFLTKEGLCSIQKQLGEDYLCDTCRKYPRILYDVGDIAICYLTNSCPEVNRMLIKKREPLQIIFDNSEKEENLIDDETRIKMDYAFSAFNAGIGILQNRSITINDRLYLLLFFIDRFQQIMHEKGNPTNIIAVFTSSKIYMQLLNNSTRNKFDIRSKIHSFYMIYSAMMVDNSKYVNWNKGRDLLEWISNNVNRIDFEKFTELYEKSYNAEMQIEAEQILVYRFFAMFLKGFEKSDYFEKVAYECIIQAAMMTYIVLSEMQFGEKCSDEDKIMFYSICSRIDHAKKKEELEQNIRNNGYYSLEKLLKVIS